MRVGCGPPKDWPPGLVGREKQAEPQQCSPPPAFLPLGTWGARPPGGSPGTGVPMDTACHHSKPMAGRALRDPAWP